MMNRKVIIALISVVCALIAITGCTLHPKIGPDEAYVRIKPIAPLSEVDRSNIPENLIITVENVADTDNSYKNRLDMYVNKYLIKPDEVYNYKNAYTYKLRLQEGVYKVKGVYFANTGWQEQGFNIETRDNVKVYFDKRAVLNVKLEKNHWGAPVEKTSYFTIKYESLTSN